MPKKQTAAQAAEQRRLERLTYQESLVRKFQAEGMPYPQAMAKAVAAVSAQEAVRKAVAEAKAKRRFHS